MASTIYCIFGNIAAFLESQERIRFHWLICDIWNKGLWMPSKTEEKIMDPMACLNRREGLNQTSKIVICEIGHEGMVLNQILMCPILKYDQ